MSILKEILDHKSQEVKVQRAKVSEKSLEDRLYFKKPIVSMKVHLKSLDKIGIISEIKRSSPSEGSINSNIDVEHLSKGYIEAGASALSVLSDYKYFGGTLDDVLTARKFNDCPILRKEFIVDEYQLLEARSVGADCILLIAAALSEKRCNELADFAKSIGLEVLLEVHNKQEIDSHISASVDVVGVNNRNLHNFTTSIQTSIELSEYIPNEFVKISESGITSAEHIVELKKHGFEGFLIGTHFMNHKQPNEACAKLIQEVKKLELQ
jgi:indole-3-glycerol phosphate synthase